MSTDRNRRLPRPAWSDPQSGITPRYPYIKGERDINGGYELVYRDVSDEKLASSERVSPTGSYEAEQYHSETGEVKTRLNRGDIFEYTVGGQAETIDGHRDSKISSTSRQVVTGDVHLETGRNLSEFISGGSIRVARESQADFVIGASESINYRSSAGDVVNEHSGNYHEAFQKDLITSVTKNAILMVNEGDYAVHVQSGNYDTHVKEKIRLFAEKEILIESETKITLKVGNSVIVIDPSNIEITSSNLVDINSGRIDLN